MDRKTKEKNKVSYGTGSDVLFLVKGDPTSKKVAKIAKEKRFSGIILWLSKKEAFLQHTILPLAFLGKESYGPISIIEAIKAYKSKKS